MADRPDPTADAVLRLDGVTQVFKTRRGDIHAVDDVSLGVVPGEVLCLVGQSGSGKSTAAKIASGLRRPTGGHVLFEGEDIYERGRGHRARFKRFRRAVQYVHQDPYSSINPTRDVFSTLSAPLLRHRLVKSRAEAVDKVSELLEQVELKPAKTFLPKFPHQLSGGQRQRIAVARGLALQPRIIIADEATSMLDVSLRIGLLNVLSNLKQNLGVGFLFITHDLAMAKYFGQGGDMAVMHRGRIVEYGPTLDVIENPQDSYTQALLEAVPEADPDLARQKREVRLATGTYAQDWGEPAA